MRYLILLGVLFFTQLLPAQSSWVDTKQQVKKYCLNEKFDQALDLLESNKIALRTDEEGLFLQGVCLYHLNQLDRARAVFSDILDGRKAPVSEILLYLARIYHSRHQFDKAVELYKEYLKVLPPKHPYRPIIRDEIKMCSNGIRLQFRQSLAFVENLGGDVNTPYDEFGPVLSPNHQGTLYFSSDRPGNFGGPRNQYGQPDEFYGHHTNDIFSCKNVSGTWTNTQRMHFLINSNAHDIIFGFDPSGGVMYYYQGRSLDNGRILIDTFQRADQRRLSVNPFLGPVRANADYAMPFFQGDSIVVFSSDQMGGYGGKDLFMSVSVNGQWTPPQNLGPSINSAYDETTPYLTDGGEALYFSSNNPDYSIGGFDILKSFFDKGKRDWYLPLNLGMPINSAGDDAYFRLGYDGYSAFFASNRKDGMGKRDLFIAYFNDEVLEKPMLVAQTAPPKQNSNPPVALSPAEQETTPSPPPPSQVTPPAAADPFSSSATSDPFGASNTTPPASAPADVVDNSYEFPRGVVVKVPTIVFDDPGSILKNRGEAQFKQVLSLAKRYPQLKLIVSVYSTVGVSMADRLLNGTIQAEKFANYFIQNGLRAENIQLRGLNGLGLSALGGKPYALELDVSGKKEVPVEIQAVTLSEDQVPENRLVYKFQFAEQSESFEDPLFEKSDYPLVEKNGRLFRYMAGDFLTYQEAREAFDRLSRKRREHMRITVFAEGIRLEENELGRFTGMYPDLNNMIKDN
jgi:tetratricopeptide (TPR) repeat protein